MWFWYRMGVRIGHGEGSREGESMPLGHQIVFVALPGFELSLSRESDVIMTQAESRCLMDRATQAP